jgi:hypothetical protein
MIFMEFSGAWLVRQPCLFCHKQHDCCSAPAAEHPYAFLSNKCSCLCSLGLFQASQEAKTPCLLLPVKADGSDSLESVLAVTILLT